MRLIGLAFILSLILAPLAAEGQQAEKVWRVGYLSSSSAERERTRFAAFPRLSF